MILKKEEEEEERGIKGDERWVDMASEEEGEGDERTD